MKYLVARLSALTAVAAVASALCAPACAASLGPIKLLSRQGEPLLGDVDLPQLTIDEMAVMRAGLGSRADYQAASMQYDPSLEGLKIILLRRPDGRYFLRLAGDKPVASATLDVILQLQVGPQTVWRDYSVAVRANEAQGPGLALGMAHVLSRRGEPLRAEIDVPMMPKNSAGGVQAGIASQSEFAAAGIPYNPALSDVKMKLEERNGRTVVSVTSEKPVDEAALNLVLDASWSAGRIVRDYSLPLPPAAPAPVAASSNADQRVSSGAVSLATPPTTSTPAPTPAPQAAAPAAKASSTNTASNAGGSTAAIASAPPPAPPPAAPPAIAPKAPASAPGALVAKAAPLAPPPAVVAKAPLPAPPPPAVAAKAPSPPAPPVVVSKPPTPVLPVIVPKAPPPAPPPVVAKAPPTSPAAVRVRVKAGDTATRIAIAHKPAGVSLDQLLAAMVDANPTAFSGGNVNRLKAGAILTLPSAAQATARSEDEAIRILAVQEQEFDEWRRRAAQLAVPARAIDLARTKPASSVEPPHVVRNRLAVSNAGLAGLKESPAIAEELRRRAEVETRLTEEIKAITRSQNVRPAPPAQPAQPATKP